MHYSHTGTHVECNVTLADEPQSRSQFTFKNYKQHCIMFQELIHGAQLFFFYILYIVSFTVVVVVFLLLLLSTHRVVCMTTIPIRYTYTTMSPTLCTEHWNSIDIFVLFVCRGVFSVFDCGLNRFTDYIFDSVQKRHLAID